jgi:imidazolonepropionase
MKRPLALVGCGQLVTLAGPERARVGHEMADIAMVQDGALLVRDGRIEATGPRAEIEPKITAEYDVVEAQGRVVLPGFVDAHTHTVFAGTRVDEFERRARGESYEEIAAAGGGIRSTVRKTREASEEALLAAANRRLPWFLRNGTTTIEVKSGYGLSPEAELKMLRVVRQLGGAGPLRTIATFLGAHEIPDEFRGRPAAYVDLIEQEMLPVIAREKLAEYCDVFCEPKIFDVAAARRVLIAARKHGLGLRVHADQLSRSGAAELAAEMRAATADHLEQTDSTGIEALLRGNVQPVLLPGSAYMLGSKRFAPAREMIDRGLAIVLATDFNPGSSPTPSMPFVLSLASTQMRMTPAEALTAATVNAAFSLGRGHQIGTLEPAKAADFVIHDCSDYREIAYHTGVETAAAVYINGELVHAR